MMMTDSTELHSALGRHFGFAAFRPGQEEVIARIGAGENLLVVMPTGAGKSLCYQLPAVTRAGTTLVVSPLIALMKDQLDALAAHGIIATFINSSIPVGEQMARLEQMRAGKFKLVYVAPERFRSAGFARSVAATDMSLLVIDEAHCISEWGHDFRPDYMHLKSVIHAFQERNLPSFQVVALTATATRRVQQDIVRQLGLPQMKAFVTGFNRANLFFDVQYAMNVEEKYRLLTELLQTHFPDAATSGIVYCGTRKNAEEVAAFLRERLGRSAAPYHAGLPEDVRRSAQDDFQSGRVPIFAATNAFGMGVDKPDVRFVIHFTIPQSAEAYYQEAGRAGRDGQPAHCALIFCPEDSSLIDFLIRAEVPTGDEVRRLFGLLASRADADNVARVRAADLERLLDMRETKSRLALHQLELNGALRRHVDSGYGMTLELTARELAEAHVAAIERNLQQRLAFKRAQFAQIAGYAETNECRRRYLLAYFGDTLASLAEGRCCDSCEQNQEGNRVELPPDLARVAPVILTGISRLKFRLGRDKVADMLRGSQAKWVREWGLERNRYYGALAAYSGEVIRNWIDELAAARLLKRVGARQPVLALTPRGLALVKESAVEWDPASGPLPPVPPTRAPKPVRATGESTLFVTLQMFRDGKTVEEIVTERALTLQTVSEHLAEHVKMGSIRIEDLVPSAVQAQVRAAIAEVGGERLRPIKEILPDEITYEQIRWVVAAEAFAAGLAPDDASSIKPAVVSAQPIEVDVELFDTLKKWRLAKAHERKLPPYVILHDVELRNIAAIHPRTLGELRRIKGIGEKKTEEYGAEILALVARHTTGN